MPFFKTNPVSVKRAGHNLVASFATANPPLVWNFDLERNHSFTVAMQGEAGDWELGITSPKGEFYPIAHFPAKEDAEEALAKVQNALLKGTRSWFWLGVKVVLAVIILTAVYLAYDFYRALAPIMPATSTQAEGLQQTNPTYIPSPAATPDIKPGVPMSADDVLQPPSR